MGALYGLFVSKVCFLKARPARAWRHGISVIRLRENVKGDWRDFGFSLRAFGAKLCPRAAMPKIRMDVPPWRAAGYQVWCCALRNTMPKIRMDADFRQRKG
jgi:hypothetical protein